MVSLLLLTACGGPPEARPERPPPLVEAVEARQGRLPLQATVNGLVRADNQVAIRPEVAGTVVEVLVRSGDAVTRGQALVRLEGDELRERLRQAEADVRLAEASLAEARARVLELEARVRRTRTLAAEDLVSAQDLEVEEAQLGALEASADQAAARVDQARATAEERRSALTKTVVRAPVVGRVGQRQVEVGQRVDSGSVLFLVGNLDEMRVEVPLTEEMLGRVEAGMPVEVSTDDAAGSARSSAAVEAKLSRVSPFLAEESFTTVGEIDLDSPPSWLRPGMFVTVRIFYGESAPATLVPASALWEEPASGQRGLFVVEDADGLVAPAVGETTAALASGEVPQEVRRVSFRPASVLAEGGGEVGITGLDAGDWVVTLGQQMLWDQAEDGAEGEASADAAEGSAGRVAARARVRPIAWQRVRDLQSLQREDLLADFLAKQQRVAAALGAEIPASEDEVVRVLSASNDGSTDGPPGTSAGGGAAQ